MTQSSMPASEIVRRMEQRAEEQSLAIVAAFAEAFPGTEVPNGWLAQLALLVRAAASWEAVQRSQRDAPGVLGELIVERPVAAPERRSFDRFAEHWET